MKNETTENKELIGLAGASIAMMFAIVAAFEFIQSVAVYF